MILIAINCISNTYSTIGSIQILYHYIGDSCPPTFSHHFWSNQMSVSANCEGDPFYILYTVDLHILIILHIAMSKKAFPNFDYSLEHYASEPHIRSASST